MALLAIDVGNTQTVFGLFEGDELHDHWRVATERQRSGDELGALFGSFVDLGEVDGIALASTVPQLHRSYEDFAKEYAKVELLDLGPGVRTGSPAGEYVGGVLAPGIEVSMDALFSRAARLFKVDFAEPETVIAKNTASSLQSGLVYGFAGQVDGIVERIRGELGVDAQTVATGGLADLIVPHARTLERIDPFLTLEGVRIVWQRNHE
jgi:type III pantothenate kinase